jgi:hypothetical protein
MNPRSAGLQTPRTGVRGAKLVSILGLDELYNLGLQVLVVSGMAISYLYV